MNNPSKESQIKPIKKQEQDQEQTLSITGTVLASFNALSEGFYSFVGAHEYLSNKVPMLTNNISSLTSALFATIIDYMVYGENINEGIKELKRENSLSRKSKCCILLFNLLSAPGAFLCFAAAAKMSLIPFLAMAGLSIGTGGVPLIIAISSLATIAFSIVIFNTISKLIQKKSLISKENKKNEYILETLARQIKELLFSKSKTTTAITLLNITILSALIACQIASIVGTFTFLGPIGLAAVSLNTNAILSILASITVNFYIASQTMFTLKNTAETVNRNLKVFTEHSSSFFQKSYDKKLKKIKEVILENLKPISEQMKSIKEDFSKVSIMRKPIFALNILLETILNIIQKTWLQICLVLHCLSIGLTTSKAFSIPIPVVAISNALVEVLIDWNYVNKENCPDEGCCDHGKVPRAVFLFTFSPVILITELLGGLAKQKFPSKKEIFNKWCSNKPKDLVEDYIKNFDKVERNNANPIHDKSNEEKPLDIEKNKEENNKEDIKIETNDLTDTKTKSNEQITITTKTRNKRTKRAKSSKSSKQNVLSVPLLSGQSNENQMSYSNSNPLLNTLSLQEQSNRDDTHNHNSIKAA